MNETTNCQVSSAIIYGIEDRPPFKEALFLRTKSVSPPVTMLVPTSYFGEKLASA